MTSDKTWVVVAHLEDARFFAHNNAGSGVRLLKKFDHPEGRLRSRDLVSDRPGRSFRPTDQSHQGYSSTVEPDEKVALDFARKVADEIRHGRATNLFTNVVLVAGPHFLGLIRGFLDRRTLDCVVASVSKNLAQLAERELAVELAEQLSDADRAAALSA